MTRRTVVHLIPNPVSGLRFVEPLVRELAKSGFDAELWIEPGMGTDSFISLIRSKKRLLRFNLTANPISNLSRFLGLWWCFRLSRPGCVHAHQTRGSLLPLLAAVFSGVRRRVYHNHGSAYWGTKGAARLVFGLIERLNCALATHVLFVSTDLRVIFVRDGLVRAAKATVLGPGSASGIDLLEYPSFAYDETRRREHRANIGIAEGQFVVLYVGRPFRRKGFDFLLNSWMRSPFQAAGDLLVLAGCSEEDVARVLGSGRTKGVRALGYCRDLRPWYVASDVVVLPSHHEGFSYALLEAGACGRPIVASDVSGIRSFVSEGVEGLLHPVEDEGKFIAALSRLKSAPELRSAMGSRARRKTLEYDQKNLTRLMVGYYESIFSAEAQIRNSEPRPNKPRRRPPTHHPSIQPDIPPAKRKSE